MTRQPHCPYENRLNAGRIQCRSRRLKPTGETKRTARGLYRRMQCEDCRHTFWSLVPSGHVPNDSHSDRRQDAPAPNTNEPKAPR